MVSPEGRDCLVVWSREDGRGLHRHLEAPRKGTHSSLTASYSDLAKVSVLLLVLLPVLWASALH